MNTIEMGALLAALAVLGLAAIASGWFMRRKRERRWAEGIVARLVKEMPPGQVRFERVTGDVRKVIAVCSCGWAGTWADIPADGGCPRCLRALVCPEVPLHRLEEPLPIGDEQEGEIDGSSTSDR